MHILPGYIVVFVRAGLGGALRHGVNLAALRLLGSFPYGTLIVNVVGSLIMAGVTGH
jgi:CrcB protein